MSMKRRKRRRGCSPNASLECFNSKIKVANSTIFDNAYMHGASTVEHFNGDQLEEYCLIYEAFKYAYSLYSPCVAEAFSHGVTVQKRRVYG